MTYEIDISKRELHGREQIVYQHAWFMRHMTHVMTTWLFFEGSPPRDCKMPMAVKKVFISMRGLRFTGRALWQLVYFLAHVIDESEKCPMFVNKMCTRLLFDASHASRS